VGGKKKRPRSHGPGDKKGGKIEKKGLAGWRGEEKKFSRGKGIIQTLKGGSAFFSKKKTGPLTGT